MYCHGDIIGCPTDKLRATGKIYSQNTNLNAHFEISLTILKN